MLKQYHLVLLFAVVVVVVELLLLLISTPSIRKSQSEGCYGSYTKTQRIHFICFLTDGIGIRQQMHLGNTNEAYV